MCDRQISTESGILTCDKKTGHAGMHHARHGGGLVPDPWGGKGPMGSTEIQKVTVPALNVEWPQEGMNEPVKITKG